MVLRVVTYNVRRLRDDHRAVAATIRGCHADVVCLQEAPAGPRRRRDLRWLSRAVGMPVAAGGRATMGTAILARADLPVRWRHDLSLRRKPDLTPRGAALAVLGVAGAVPFGVASVHLDLRAPARLDSVDEVLDAIAGAPPVSWVVGGDLNERPDAEAFRALDRVLPDAYERAASRGGGATFPARGPAARIDAVFADRAIAVSWCGTAPGGPGVDPLPPPERASDHVAVLAVLQEIPAR